MNGQVALVTGSSRGIGFAAARALSQEGFAVAINDLEASDELAHALESLHAEGAVAESVPFDVADLASHEAALARIEDRLGPLTTLVNNAGVGVMQRGDPLEAGVRSWDRCICVNARAMFFLTQAFSRRLLARERDPSMFHAIVNVTSSNAVAVAVPRAEYCASKAAASMVSKVWAVRLGAENIAVYEVQPGLIDTAMTAPVIDGYRRQAKEGLTLFPQVGQPEDVGNVIASLASGRLPYTTGQAISVDAGMLVPRF